MKYKTSELTGALLDAAVAKAAGGELSADGITVDMPTTFGPSGARNLSYGTRNFMGMFACKEEARAFVAHKLGEEVEL